MIKRLLLTLVLSCTPVLATFNAEVPLEFLTVDGVASSSSAATLFSRSQMEMNDADYDGATYYLEASCTNDNADTNYSVSLVREDNTDVTNATIQYDFGTSSTYILKRSSSFTPDTGSTVYRVKMPQTASNSDLKCRSVRIIVSQSSATKTRIQIPLLTSNWDNVNLTDDLWVDNTTSTSYTQGSSNFYGYWLKDYTGGRTEWDTVDGASVEMVGYVTGGSTTGYAGLHISGGGALVTGAEATVTATSCCEHDVVDFTHSNMTEGNTHEFKIKNSGSWTTRIHKANLYLSLSSAVVFEVYWLIGKEITALAADTELVSGRMKYDATAYSSPAVYWEATMFESSSGTVTYDLSDCGTSDSAGTCTPVSGSPLATASATREIQASSALTMTDDNRYIPEVTWTDGAFDSPLGWVVVQVNGSAAAGDIPIFTHHYRLMQEQ